MARPFGLRISPDLGITVGTGTVVLTPAAGLRVAEDLARKSFRKALAEEAGKLEPKRRGPASKAKQS